MMHRHGTCQTVATESQNVKESAFANVGCCSQNRRLATSDCHIVDYIVLYWRYYIMNHIALCHSMLYHYCYYLDVVIYIYIYIHGNQTYQLSRVPACSLVTGCSWLRW